MLATGASLAARRRVASFTHEMLVELFRNRGELATALLDAHTGIAFPHHHVEQASIDLSQVVSTEYRADAVVELRDAQNAAVAAIIVEVQLGIDRDKEYSWPVYVPALRARLRCPVVLLVLTPDPGVARWARAPIALGHPKLCLEPVVIEYTSVPRVTDVADAHRLPELAVLSTLAHRDLFVAGAAIEAIERLPDARKRLYLDAIRSALRTGKPEDTHMATAELQQWLDNRRREQALGEVLLDLLEDRLYIVTPAEVEAIGSWGNGPRLRKLVAPILRATTAEEIRSLLASLPTGRDMFSPDPDDTESATA
jgi:hypothetical protein